MLLIRGNSVVVMTLCWAGPAGKGVLFLRSAGAGNRPRCFAKMGRGVLVIALAIIKPSCASLLLWGFSFFYWEAIIHGQNV